MEKRKKIFEVKAIKRPFRSHDVQEYDEIYIEGYSFPVKMTSSKLKVKDNREVKPPAPHTDMIKALEKSGVQFSENEEVMLLSLLPSINYYRLSVFALYLEEDKSFNHLLNLYYFDRFLMESINKLTPPIEILLKTTLAYYLSTGLTNKGVGGALVYLNYEIYKNKHVKNNDVNEMISIFSEFISDKQDKDPSIKHHVEYYGGNIPIWVLVEHLTLGNVGTFVTYLDRGIRKNWVRSFLPDTNDKWIVEWIKTIQFLRNTGAHCSRFYGKRFNYNPTIHPDEVRLLPEKLQTQEGQKELDKLTHTFFGGLLIMKRFYKVLPQMEKDKWKTFLNKLEDRLTEYRAIRYYIGLPENWKDLLSL